jgi:hypothetical protein
MKLYEAFTFVIITALIFAFSGELFDVFFVRHARDCYKSNLELIQNHQHGPLRNCN